MKMKKATIAMKFRGVSMRVKYEWDDEMIEFQSATVDGRDISQIINEDFQMKNDLEREIASMVGV